MARRAQPPMAPRPSPLGPWRTTTPITATARMKCAIRTPSYTGTSFVPTALLLYYAHPAPARMPATLPAPGLRAHDGREGRGIQARAADEGAVDLRLGDELADVLRRDAAPVEHARLLRPFAEPLGQPPPDQPADAVRLHAGGRPS